ncbi:hypothetical protein C8A03DRAFT_11041 [Achaetomium macrosporum]|uniref:Uncharacterized protein n=1 Tax=Achaetomium macrosporum TaxID=79813 RepID=A0AAN7HHZ6_9PEZI|nr:hypothetical protein C8A03DRAFT_11041 [Achaetomium macrosporum]
MVTTRRGARLADDDSSSGDSDIPAQSLSRRRPATPTSATLRPPIEPAESSNRAKGKRKATTSDTPQKRSRHTPDVKDSIEVQLEDDSVDAVINVTDARHRRIEIPLPTRKGLWGEEDVRRNDGAISTIAPSEPSIAGVRGPRPRAKLIAETPRHERLHRPAQYEGQGSDKEDDELLGSPEVQSSAVKCLPRRPASEIDEEPESRGRSPKRRSSAPKRRPKKPMADIYDLPEEGELESQRLSPDLHSPAPERPPVQQLQRPAATRRPRIGGSDRNGPGQVEEADEFGGSEELEEADGFGELEEREEAGELDDSDKDLDSMDETQGRVGTNPVPILIRPFTANQHPIRTMIILSDHINNMLRIMGKSGWTGAGSRWGIELIQVSRFDFEYVSPALTRLGKSFFKALGLLKDILEDIPNALDLANQSQFLEGQEQGLSKAIRRVDRVVSKIKALETPFNPERRPQISARFNEAVVNGLCSYVIPMFVLVLQSSFAVGIQQPDAEASTPLPKQGIFTGVTAQILLWISKWLLRLYKILMRQLSSQADGDPDVEEDQDPENPRQNRERFGVMLRKWDEHLRYTVDTFNEQVDRERDVLKKKRRDEETREAKRKKEEEELALAREQEKAWKRSLAEVMSRPRPFAEVWHKATQHWPASQSGRSSSTSRPRPHTQLRLRPSSSETLSEGQTAPQAAPSYPPWPVEDTIWLLEELKKPNRPRGFLELCAQLFERPLWEVREEKERLKRLGRYRSPVR